MRIADIKLPAGRMLVLRTDGSQEVIERKPTLDAISAIIGAETIDTVNIGRATGSDLVMAVNDRGHETKAVERGGVLTLVPTKPLFPVNAAATALYLEICIPGTTHQIVGDVVIVRDRDFDPQPLKE